MSNYAKLKKLDESSLQRLREGAGPVDECLCALLSTEEKKTLGASVKKAFKAFGSKRTKSKREVAIDFNNGFQSRQEVVKREKCGKCGCDKEKIVLKHSYANIRITSPDVSSICPCPTDCLPDKEKLRNNIKVIVENADIRTLSPNSTEPKM